VDLLCLLAHLLLGLHPIGTTAAVDGTRARRWENATREGCRGSITRGSDHACCMRGGHFRGTESTHPVNGFVADCDAAPGRDRRCLPQRLQRRLGPATWMRLGSRLGWLGCGWRLFEDGAGGTATTQHAQCTQHTVGVAVGGFRLALRSGAGMWCAGGCPPSTAARNATSLFNAVVDTFACDVCPNEWARQVWSLDMDILMQEQLSLVLGVHACTRNGHAMTSLAACEVLNG